MEVINISTNPEWDDYGKSYSLDIPLTMESVQPFIRALKLVYEANDQVLLLFPDKGKVKIMQNDGHYRRGLYENFSFHEKKITLLFFPEELDAVIYFLEDYVRNDGIASVDHMDIDFEYNGVTSFTLAIYVDKAQPGIPIKEWRKHNKL